MKPNITIPSKLEDEATRYWRVIKNTRHPGTEEMNEMIGGIFEERGYSGFDKTVSLYNEDKSNSWWFNLSDLQEVFPMEIDEYWIGKGDTVVYYNKEYVVYDCIVWDNAIRIYAYDKSKKPFENCYSFFKESITKVIPLTQSKLPMTHEEMIAELIRAGKIWR